jgi:hypothetical protein
MKINNPGLKIVVGANQDPVLIEDYTGLPHRGKLETQSAYKKRRHEEKINVKHRGKWVHVSKVIRDDPKDKNHKFIDGDGTYRKDTSES